ncbi:MAG: hypothetical protein IH614_20580 [Desulfuromonadales bacterium]|nr:hypothetical protein [Desulfuromonadales bacterium]
MDCISTTSLKHCTCSDITCDRRGNCCKCVIHHQQRGEIPGCFFTPAGERTFDRSVAHLCRDRLG